jgi:K+-sensing histidine kinase KdpD
VSRTEGSNPSPSALWACDGGHEEVAADAYGDGRRRVVDDPVRRARFQPLLLTGAYLAVLPTLVATAHPARTLLLVVGAIVAGGGVLAWWWGRSGERSSRQRERVALGLTLAAAPAFLALVSVLGADRPESYLPLGAALLCSMAPATRTWLRVPVQLLTVVFYAALLVEAGRSVPDLLLPLVLLGSVGVLASALAHDLVDLGAAERRARQDAQRRAELLTAVRSLPGATLDEALAAACATMRSLGFDAAGCAVRRGDRLVNLHLDGLPDSPASARPGEGLAWACVAENRTIVTGDYQADPRHLEARPQVGSAVVVPIRIDGVAIGSLMGARQERSTPSPAEVEVAEVLAAHLGAVFATEETVRRQRELLTRMGQLETMRSTFVAQVSDELRDPLTVVRGVAATLTAHGTRLDPQQRTRLFERMGEQTDQLRRTIDALLDFSRFQSTRPQPSIEVVDLAELLGPVLSSTDAALSTEEGELAALVQVDGDLVRHALELLVTGTGAVEAPPQLRLSSDDGHIEIAVQADAEANAAPALVRSLAAQLLVAAGAALGEGADPVVRLPLVGAEVMAP